MSTKGVFKVKCPACGEQFDADFWTVVRGDKDLELKELLISGEFDLLMCPNCSAVVSYEETFIYLDPSRELLAFVMPEACRAEKEKWLEKMRSDYATLKGSLLNEKSLSFEPACFFGAAELSALLLTDRDMEEETEVMEFMAAERKYRTVPVRPAYARAHDLPFSLPYAGAAPDRESALKAVRDLAAANDALKRVANLLKALEGLKTAEISFMVSHAHAS